MSATENLKEEHEVIMRMIRILSVASDRFELEKELGIIGGEMEHGHH